MSDDLKERLCATLNLIRETAGTDFSGAGLLVCENVGRLPIFPLRNESNPSHSLGDVQFLGRVSTKGHLYHDGFHVVNENMTILRLAQYFSPPIVEGLNHHVPLAAGGRYLAALFGSCISEVLLSGIATNALGVVIFERGTMVLRRELG